VTAKYFIDHDIHSPRLAGICFQIMNANLRFNICGLETSHLHNNQVEDLAACIQQCIPACLSYACRFAAKHLWDTDNDMPLYQELLAHVAEFLHVQLLHWLEVMSLIGEVPMALACLQSIKQWIQVSANMVLLGDQLMMCYRHLTQTLGHLLLMQ
jgi:hypothetical protein